MRKGVKRYFVTGLLVVVPLYISFYILMLVAGFVDSLIYMLPGPLNPASYLPFKIPGFGIAVTVLVTFLAGVVATNFLGKKLVEIGEAILSWIPIIRTVYKGSKQFMETFFTKEGEGFRRVVLVEFPRKGLYSVGFVTSKARGEIQTKTKEVTINVFIPTTPNPTSGFYVAVPEDQLVSLEMSVEDAFKVIMSGGMVVPERSGETGRQ